jgi:hypothetical protein
MGFSDAAELDCSVPHHILPKRLAPFKGLARKVQPILPAEEWFGSRY